jgi:hypothetical protein
VEPPAAARPQETPRSSRGVVLAVLAVLLVAGAAAAYLLRDGVDGGASMAATRPSSDAPAPAPLSPDTTAPADAPPPAPAPESAPSVPGTGLPSPSPAPPAASPPPGAAEPPEAGVEPPAATTGAAGADPEARMPATDLTVVLARMCRELTPSGAWRCVPPDEPAQPGRLYFFTRVATPRPAQIVHRWYYDDELVQAVALRIAASSREGFRTYSRQTIEAARRGAWRVELLAEDGRVLAEERFTVQ